MLGQQPDRCGGRTGPRLRDLLGETFEGFPDILGTRDLQARKRHLRQGLVVSQRPARGPCRNGRGQFAIDDRVGGVVEAQLDTGTEQGLVRHPKLPPPAHRNHQMKAVTGGLKHEPGEGIVERLKIAAKQAVTVHQQHDVGAGKLWQPASGVHGAQLRHRIDATGLEQLFPGTQHEAEFLHQPSHPVGVSPRRHPADVRETLDASETTTGQVHAVDGHLLGGGVQGEGGCDRAQQRGAPGLWPADDRDMAATAGQIQRPGKLTLMRRIVFQADDHFQRIAVRLLPHLPERQMTGQWRQPDRGDGGVVGPQPRDDLFDERASRVRVAQQGNRRITFIDLNAVVDREFVDARTRGHCFLTNPARHRSGDVACAESLIHRGVDLQVSVPRHGRQMEGIGRAEHHLGFRLTEGPQTEPIGQIGVQATQFPTLDPLAGEQ